MLGRKCVELENKIYEGIRKNILPIGFVIITIFAIFARYLFLDFETWDYTGFLKVWIDTIVENGRIHSLSMGIGDYNCPYMFILTLLTYLKINSLYSIKIISIFFDFVLAIASAILVNKVTKKEKFFNITSLITYTICLFAPTILLNSACWAQCDSIYASFVVISLIFLVEEKYIPSFVLLGVAFAFKLQFIFILPLYILVWLNKRKFPVLYFGIIPIVNFIMCLPSVLFGRPIKEVLMVYIKQMGSYSVYTSNNFPSIYNLFCKLTEKSEALAVENLDITKVGIVVTITIFALMAFYIVYKEVKLSKKSIVKLGLWSILVATFFMPNMHDRYMYIADLLSLVLCMIEKDKKNIAYAIVINLNSFSVYVRYLFKVEFIPIQLASILQLIVIVGITYHLHEELSGIKCNKKKVIEKREEKVYEEI